MSQFVDTFTDTDDTFLSDHTPDTGTDWTLTSGTTEVFEIYQNYCGFIEVPDEVGYYSDDLGSSDLVVIIKDIYSLSSFTANVHAGLRATDAENFLGIQWGGLLPSYRIIKYDSDNFSRILDTSGASALIEDAWLKIEAEGNEIRLYHGGTGATPSWTLAGSVTETFNNTATRQGVFKKGGGLTNSRWIDRYEADTIGGGGTTVDAGAALQNLMLQFATRVAARLNGWLQ